MKEYLMFWLAGWATTAISISIITTIGTIVGIIINFFAERMDD